MNPQQGNIDKQKSRRQLPAALIVLLRCFFTLFDTDLRKFRNEL